MIILLIAKYWKKKLIQLLILGAIGYTSAYLFYPLLSLVIPTSFSANIPIGENYYFIIPVAGVLAVALAIILIYILYKFPEWYVIDISGIIVGAGAIAIFGMSLGILLVIILLFVLAVYDAISVYKTKHMIDLADTVMDLKLPILLVIPKIRKYSLIKETKSFKEKIKGDQEREAFFIGLGDVVMPGILVTSAFNNIQDGINNVSQGGSVYIYEGIYNENIIVNKSINIIGEDKVTTIIEGNDEGDTVSIVVDDCTIQNINIRNCGGYFAGVKISSNKNLLSNNIIYNNYAGYYGGGITCRWYSTPSIKDNIIRNNACDQEGGGLYCSDYCSGLVENNTIIANIGGGIRTFRSAVTFQNNLITHNNGHGISIWYKFDAASPSVINNTIVDNSACGNCR